MKSKEKYKQDEWFRGWFNDRYLQVYHHRDEAEAQRFIDNLPVWNRFSRGCRALDIGCGSGRHAHLISQKGFDTYGLDLSMPLLRRAVQDNPVSTVSFVRGDMRTIPFNTKFDLIVCLFTSFGYFASDSEHCSVIRDVAKLLSQGGCFILDVPNPESVLRKLKSESDTVRRIDNLEIIEERTITSHPLRVNKRITIKENSVTDEYNESVRLYTQAEILSMTDDSGLREFIPMWGGYDGSALNGESDRMIYFGEVDD